MTKEEALNEIMKAVEYKVLGYDNTNLVKSILEVFEKQVRIDQIEKDRKMTLKNFKDFDLKFDRED